MSRKIILIKQELLLLVYELNRSGLLAENEKIRPRSEERFSRNAETDLVCRLLLEKKNTTRRQAEGWSAEGASVSRRSSTTWCSIRSLQVTATHARTSQVTSVSH